MHNFSDLFLISLSLCPLCSVILLSSPLCFCLSFSPKFNISGIKSTETWSQVMMNEVEEQYVQTEQRLAKVDRLPDMEEGIPNQLQRLMCKRDDTPNNLGLGHREERHIHAIKITFKIWCVCDSMAAWLIFNPSLVSRTWFSTLVWYLEPDFQL